MDAMTRKLTRREAQRNFGPRFGIGQYTTGGDRVISIGNLGRYGENSVASRRTAQRIAAELRRSDADHLQGYLYVIEPTV